MRLSVVMKNGMWCDDDIIKNNEKERENEKHHPSPRKDRNRIFKTTYNVDVNFKIIFPRNLGSRRLANDSDGRTICLPFLSSFK